MATTLTLAQHGVTWTFAEQTEYGQFVNGDYWVVDPGAGVSITDIDPGYVLYGGTRPENGSMVNPGATGQGYDGAIESQYDASKNVAIGISGATPLVLIAGQSLISTVSDNEPGDSNFNSYIESAAVLTCLSAPPPEGTFRPGISSATKTLHNISSVNTSLLKSLAFPSGQSRLDITTYANYFQMVWLAHSGNNLVRYMHPNASGLGNYYYPEKFAEAALLLHMDYTPQEKLPLLINYIQLGIDLYSYLESGAVGWWPDGGHAQGRKWPILFAGIMLDYAPMKTIGQVSGDYLYADGYGPGNPPPDYKYFGEDGQTFYVAQETIDRETVIGTPYSAELLGMPEWSFNHSVNPTRDSASWTAAYRTNGALIPSWAGITLAANIMGVKSLWKNNALFDYTDRYLAISSGDADPFGYTVPDQQSGNRPSGFTAVMYDTYRMDYAYPPYSAYSGRKSEGTGSQVPGTGTWF